MKRWQLWIIAMLALAVFANLPRNHGPLKPHLGQAGFPFVYVSWQGNENAFYLTGVVANILVWLVLTALVGALTARFPHRSPRGDKPLHF